MIVGDCNVGRDQQLRYSGVTSALIGLNVFVTLKIAALLKPGGATLHRPACVQGRKMDVLAVRHHHDQCKY